MTQDQKITNLEHTNRLLHQRIELLELQLQIEQRKLEMEKLKNTQRPYPYGTTWTTTNMGTDSTFKVQTTDMEALLGRIQDHMRGDHGPGTPAVS